MRLCLHFPITLFSVFCTLAMANPEPNKTLVYKRIDDVELKLHVFSPETATGSSKRPCIVFFFGGGWLKGTPTQFYPQAEYFASRGMVAISAEYRVEERHGTSPKECVKDGKSTIRWIRKNADELGIDPNKLIAAGGSAGGHVAAATATLCDYNEKGDDLSISCIPNALVLFNPVFDNGPGGYGHDRVEDYWESISPMHNLDKNTPPTIVFLGTQDEYIPVETAKTYKERMDALGIRCDLHLYEGAEHGFFNPRFPSHFEATVKKADEFLASLGYLEQN